MQHLQVLGCSHQHVDCGLPSASALPSPQSPHLAGLWRPQLQNARPGVAACTADHLGHVHPHHTAVDPLREAAAATGPATQYSSRRVHVSACPRGRGHWFRVERLSIGWESGSQGGNGWEWGWESGSVAALVTCVFVTRRPSSRVEYAHRVVAGLHSKGHTVFEKQLVGMVSCAACARWLGCDMARMF